ncbi:hypothetical protein CAPN010_13610 [Capnocytophaga cynodegmi]|uniref:DUF6620 family protein n=1 Tax=Capnocytophaga cynodegmi TaxID=28189 RepID=UPI001EE29B02|nr:DUF6620 family protein [Capnocytophaga cynodegmi]GJQ07203.1 hypothetical protein CAPN010_13610 [Capnocytophaga cynodegmi]
MFGKFFNKPRKEEKSFQGGWNEEEGVYYAKGTFDNEVEYNNEIICIINKCDYNMEDMNDAMDDKDYVRAEKVRLQWKKDLQHYINEVKQLGAYEGDNSFVEAAIKFFLFYDDLMDNGYKTLIQLRTEGKRGTPEEQAQLKENNKRIQKNMDKLNRFSDEFLERHGYEADDEEDDDYDDEPSVNYSEFVNPFMNMTHDTNNPLLQPIHGVSLEDYAAAAANMANGMSDEQVCKKLGIELPIWDEANQLWIKRMQQDTSFVVMSLYGQYFGQAHLHPKLGKQTNHQSNEDYLTRISTDEKFYYELCGARQAAYEAGLDGAKWIEDNYGISLGDFQSVAMKWMGNMINMLPYQEKKQKEYAKKFAEENGGNIADDIEF